MFAVLSNFAQDYSYNFTNSSSSSSGLGGFFWVLLIGGAVLAVIMIVAMWKIFVKAGKPGWAAIIPIYNYYVLLQIVGRPGWWLALLLLGFIPFVGSLVVLVFTIIVYNDLAKSFGKSTGFTVLLVLLPFIGLPVLGFGDAKYNGPSVLSGPTIPDAPLPKSPIQS
jgi:hypothetical protein